MIKKLIEDGILAEAQQIQGNVVMEKIMPEEGDPIWAISLKIFDEQTGTEIGTRLYHITPAELEVRADEVLSEASLKDSRLRAVKAQLEAL